MRTPKIPIREIKMKLNTKQKVLIVAICLPIMFISFCGATLYTFELIERINGTYVDVGYAGDDP